MATLPEIESAVEKLSATEQEKLLRHLEVALRRKRSAQMESRSDWMLRLDALRASLATGRLTQTGEQILEDLRED